MGFPITSPDMPRDAIGLGHDDDAVPSFNTSTILFTNFDGANLNGGCGNNSKNDCSTLGFGSILPYSGTYADRAAIVQAAREDVVDFGVVILGERPSSSQDYAMVLVGNPSGGTPNYAGVAPYIDCGNSSPNTTSFAFDIGGVNLTATIVHQEAAHTWGLEHVNDRSDNLHPTAGKVVDPKYNDVCNKIVADTDLNPANGQCNSIHTRFCSTGNQNSYQEMLLLFGGPIPDTGAPGVEFLVPSEGQALPCPANFDLTFVLSDNWTPHSLDMKLFLDGTEVASGFYVDTTLKFPISGGIDPGAHTWRVELVDESGNPGSGEVNFTLEECSSSTSGGGWTTGDPTNTDGGSGGGSEGGSGGGSGGGSAASSTGGGTTTDETTGEPDPTTGDPPDPTTGVPPTSGGERGDPSGCACTYGARPAGGFLVALMVLGARRRPRRRRRP